MDEVLAVGDIGFRMKCFAHLRQLIKEGVAIIVVSHAVSMLARVASRAIVFGQGKIVHDGDFQTGSTIYEELMKVRHDSAQRPYNQGKTDKAYIKSITLLNESGEAQNEFETGQTCQLRVEIESRESVKRLRLIAALSSPVHGVVSAVSTAHQDFQFDLQPGTSVITLELKKLPILVGAFHFNISLYGPNTSDFFHRLSYQAPFRITGPSINSDGFGIRGIMMIDHSWTKQ
jgi:lipopolysaccharide transport system ATP-binding protein